MKNEAKELAPNIGRAASILPQAPKVVEKVTLKTEDGKEYQIPVLQSTMGEKFLDIRNLYPQTNMFMFDPGYTITASCSSNITFSKEDGTLLYRGYAIEDLVDKSTFTEVCYLLLYGELPTYEELEIFEEKIKDEMVIHQKMLDFYKGFSVNAHPMAIMCSVMGGLSSFIHNTLDVRDPVQRELSAIKLIAKMPVMAAIAFRTSSGLPIVQPQKKLSYMENFLNMMFSDPLDPDFRVPKIFVDTLNKIFILHADNDQGPSTTAVRIAGSSMANPFAAIAAGIASLWGPMHGGANEYCLQMFKEIGDISNIPSFIETVKNRQAKLMGFGHRIYKCYDPRAKILKKMILDLFAQLQISDPLFDIACKLEEEALKDDYFIQRNLYPNIDFYSGFILKTLQIPNNMFNVIFAITRSTGWIAHWREMMSESMIKIGRPRQLYVGNNLRGFVKMEDREEATNFSIKANLSQ